MSKEKFWVLLGKKNSGEATPEELQELKELLLEDSSLGFTREILDKIWEAPFKTIPETSGSEDLWNSIESNLGGEKADKPSPLRPLKKWLIAASVVALAGIALWFGGQPKTSGKSPAGLSHITTKANSKSKIQLPDGTEVWLNANSQLTYNNEVFGKKNREVTLTGEAFFDVTHNEDVPFIIHASAIDITVKGTAFNVKAYPYSRVIETSLVRGLVEIATRKNPERKILLRPNEKFSISMDTPVVKNGSVEKEDTVAFSSYSISRLEHKEGEAPVETFWMNSKLSFNDEPFDLLALKLQAWFNIQVHFLDEGVKTRRFTGIVEKETLEQTLRLLQLSYRFKYRIEGNQVWIGK